MATTNPFDDSDSESGGAAMKTSTNPFDSNDDIDGHKRKLDFNVRSNKEQTMATSSSLFGGVVGDDGELGFGVGESKYPNEYMEDGSHDYPNVNSNEGETEENDDSNPVEGHDSEAGGGGSIEASWQFLGDLPYRRITLYPDVEWNRLPGSKKTTKQDSSSSHDDSNNNTDSSERNSSGTGLALFPPAYLSRLHSSSSIFLSPQDIQTLLSTTTKTLVAGCPHGGPIAALTIPIASTSSSLSGISSPQEEEEQFLASKGDFLRSEIRIMSCSGLILSRVEFPPRRKDDDEEKYSVSDVLALGFTERCILIVVMRDSFCFMYNLKGQSVLPGFYILPSSTTSSTGAPKGGVGLGGRVELIEANVFGGGVAVLSTAMHAAVVEVLDEHDDPGYLGGADITARKIVQDDGLERGEGIDIFGSGGGFGGSGTLPKFMALVTPLPTAAHARANYYSYLTIAVLPRIHTQSRHPELFLSTSNNSVVIADTCQGCQIMDIDCRARIASPIVSMRFAPNGRFLACFTQGSILTVISTTFETKVLDFDTSEGSTSPPRDMQWCGEDSVVLHWKNLGILMVGPYGDWLRFPYDSTPSSSSTSSYSETLHIIGEIDCCRVLTSHTTEIIQRIPPLSASLFRIGSIEPSAMLLDASEAFEAGSPASDEAARAITKTGLIEEAIESCVDSAVREFDVAVQRRLLKASSYGMHFSYKDEGEGLIVGGHAGTDKDTPEDNINKNDQHPISTNKPSRLAKLFVSSTRKIRVLNALRESAVGFALTSSQFDSMGPTGLIARLVAMGRPALATRIAEYLDLDSSVIALARISRASTFVTTVPDGEGDAKMTKDAAVRILNGQTPFPKSGGLGEVTLLSKEEGVVSPGGYASVALAAHKAGKTAVANLLLMLEVNVKEKVPALISIGSFGEAAKVAAAAWDTNLIFLAIMAFERSCMSSDPSKSQQQFLSTVVTTLPPEAINLLKVYFSSMHDVKYAKNLLQQCQNYVEAGSIMAKRAMETGREKDRQMMLQEASRVYAMGRDSAFQKACTDEYLDLRNEQERLRTAYGTAEVAPESSSVTATVYSIIRHAGTEPRNAHRLFSDAEKLAKRFRVPEKRLWHIKVRAFSESGQWANLRNLADSRAKPPIGYKPFALAAIRGKQGIGEIIRYVDRVGGGGEEKYDLFCEARLWKRALDEAARLGDGRRIMHVQSVCNSPEIRQKCVEVLARL